MVPDQGTATEGLLSLAQIRSRLTFANVVSVIALFVALGLGTAWALEKNSVKSTHIVDDQVKSADVRDDTLKGGGLTGTDIREDTLGEVPQAASAQGAGNAQFLRGKTPSNFVEKTDEGFIGVLEKANGCLDTLESSEWANQNTSEESAGYWRDPLGVVHLRGSVRRIAGCLGETGETIFTLPAGYRPPKLEHFAVAAEDDTPPTAPLSVGSDGQVFAPGATDGDSRTLDGITFRCAPSGQDGCP